MTPGSAADPGAPRVGATRIVLILLAVMIALPAFVMGAELCHQLGAPRASAASLGGGAILAVMAALTGAAGARTRRTTYELIGNAFGRQGAKLANGVLGLSLLGWYGVVATMFGHALASVSPALATALPGWALVLVGCALTTVTAMVGFGALNVLSTLTTPLKLALLFWAFGAALRTGLGPAWHAPRGTDLPLGAGVSLVAGGLMVGATLSPDICRFARTATHAAWACALAYGLGFPMVLMLAGMPSLAAGENDLVKIMLALGLGLPAMLIVILTAWSTNTFNLYSATLIGATLRPRQPQWQLSLVAGVIGTAMGLGGVSELLVPYLLLLGICIPPIAGIYLVHAWRRAAAPAVEWRPSALVAWAMASLWAGFAPRFGVALTPVPALDSVLVSAVVFFFAPRARDAPSSTPDPIR